LTYNANGPITTSLGVGSTTPSASGAGIAFPATQSASTDPNTLDDYEEGTWTPSVGGTATYGGTNGGTYTKIGRLIIITAICEIGLIGTGSATSITNLPFAAAGTYPSSGSISYFTNLAQSVVNVVPYVNSGQSSVLFRTLTAAASTMSGGNIFQNSTRVDFTLIYITS
jgi:hypothetical protein